jgi:hypothetical protein
MRGYLGHADNATWYGDKAHKSRFQRYELPRFPYVSLLPSPPPPLSPSSTPTPIFLGFECAALWLTASPFPHPLSSQNRFYMREFPLAWHGIDEK